MDSMNQLSASGRLGGRDVVDDEPYSALYDNVRGTIADQKCTHCLRTVDVNHGEDVDDGIRQPETTVTI